MRPYALTMPEATRAARLYEQGLSLRQVASELSRSQCAISNALAAQGVPMRSRLHGTRLRHGVFLEQDGKRLTLGQWAQRLGVPYSTLKSRYQVGWPVARVLQSSLGA